MEKFILVIFLIENVLNNSLLRVKITTQFNAWKFLYGC